MTVSSRTRLLAVLLAVVFVLITSVALAQAESDGHPRVEWALLEAATAGAVGAGRAVPLGLQVRDGRVRVVVEHCGGTGPLLDGLQALGVEVEAQHEGLTRAWVPLESMGDVADLPGVGYVRRPHAPISLGVPEPRLVSEGVTLLGASLFHATGLLGQGVRIAVIDLGFGGLAQAQRVGEIHPTAVAWMRDYTSLGLETGSSHGTAVAQIAHNMAPRAKLYLMRIGDELDLAYAVLDCIEQGVDIVVHSVGWVNTDFGDGTGVIAEIVQAATAAGILWVNAAGNHADKHWTGTPAIGPGGWLEFAPGITGLELEVEFAGEVGVALTWNEWPRAVTDLDLYLFDMGGAEVAVSQSRQWGETPPSELLRVRVEPGRYTVRVRAHRAWDPVEIRIFSLNHPIVPHVPRSSILAPGNVGAVMTVGAIGFQAWQSGPQQPYSSQGPTQDGRQKPDLMGLDGVTNFAYVQFFGTSAAAPHVAGAAALLLCQARLGGGDPAAIRDLLRRWAFDLGEPGPDPVFGAGRMRLFAEPIVARRTVLLGPSPAVAPGGTVAVEVTVRMPTTQVGGLVLRETLPNGWSGVIEESGGADVVQDRREIHWSWPVLAPGEERTVRYRIEVPEDELPGSYGLLGTANHDPVDGDTSILVAALVAEREPAPRATAAPNPVSPGQPVEFSVRGTGAWELRLWVYDVAGRLVHNSGWQPGPSYQWHLQDGRGRVVAGGVYVYWLEVRGVDGRAERTALERLLVLR